MAKFKTLKMFRNREGKDLEKLSSEEVAALPVYAANKPFESDNKKWTDYLVAEGFIASVEESSSSPAPKPAPKKRTTRKKASE